MKKLVVLILMFPVLAFARQGEVSQVEASAVFAKADQVMRSVLQIKKAPPAFARGNGIATRGQILKYFATLYTALEPKFKFGLPHQKSAPEVISLKEPQLKQTAIRLESLGFLDRYGPLATSKSDGLQPQEFGDTLGYFMARVAELTHTPSSKFSPYLSK